MKTVHIFGGGTVAHLANHLAIAAPAYGATARALQKLCQEVWPEVRVVMEMTKMTGWPGAWMETPHDIANRVQVLVKDPNVRAIFFNCAIADWWDPNTNDRYGPRPSTHRSAGQLDEVRLNLTLVPTHKAINLIRKERKDIFLVGFKSTSKMSAQDAYLAGLRLCKEASCNLVLVNDAKTRRNMVVTPEEAAYHDGIDNRDDALRGLVEMAKLRSHLNFTRSTVVKGEPVKWNSAAVPASLRAVVNHCRGAKAYKPFNGGGTVGHFAVKLSDTKFLTSIRRSDFNKLDTVGLVLVETDGPDTVLAYGAKPSVGGQSQRLVFRDHSGFDCIVHFHCPLRVNHHPDIPVRSQREVECGSRECGKSTSDGLAQIGNLKVVMLDQHGPNIVFPKSINPQEVIDFIETNFDLSKKTGGYQFPKT